MRRRTFLAGMGAAALQLTGCTGTRQPAPDYVLTYAENQPADYPTTQGAQYFADLVRQRTEGRIRIQVLAGGEYGTEQEVWEQLRLGGVDFARLSLSVLAADLPKLNVLMLPFLYQDAAHMRRVLDGEIGKEFLRIFPAQDVVGLSWYDAGARSFYSTTPIRTMQDLAGRVVRVASAGIMADMVRLLDAEPVTLAYSDVYSAFETGQIDTAENNWPSYYSMDHYRVARYYTLDEHNRVPEIQLVSSRIWNLLSAQTQQILQECAEESAVYERQLWAQQETEARDAALAAGCHEITLTEAEREHFRTLVQPLYPEYCADYLDLVQKIREG